MIPKLWLVAFTVWAVFLSGLLAPLVGSPGVIQAIELHQLLIGKETQVVELKKSIAESRAKSILLAKNREVQRREIRKSLGYAARDELIFVF